MRYEFSSTQPDADVNLAIEMYFCQSGFQFDLQPAFGLGLGQTDDCAGVDAACLVLALQVLFAVGQFELAPAKAHQEGIAFAR